MQVFWIIRHYQKYWKDCKLKKYLFFLVFFFLFINCLENESREVEGYVVYVESNSLTTINNLIIKDRNNKEWIFSVSATTREKRDEEVDGRAHA